MKIRYNEISTDIAELTKDFLNGKDMDFKLSNIVLKTVDRVEQIPYEEILNRIKIFFNNNKDCYDIFEGIMTINTDMSFSKAEKAVLTRYVNICHQSKKLFIVFNGELIYINPHYKDYNIKEIEIFISQAVRRRVKKSIAQKVKTMLKKKEVKSYDIPKVVRNNRMKVAY